MKKVGKWALLTLNEADLLDTFCRFLEKAGYLDSDWYAEEPTAIDRFIEDQRKMKARP